MKIRDAIIVLLIMAAIRFGYEQHKACVQDGGHIVFNTIWFTCEK